MRDGSRFLVVLGTRPEAIKLAPVITELRRVGARPIVCATAQHRGLLDQVLALFEIACDHDLDVMRANQSLPDLTGRLLGAVSAVVRRERPHLLLVQGDTTTAMASALAGFYAGVPVAHVEAGLRSDSLRAPWPEEMNRRVVSLVATLHLAPTATARNRLVGEGIARDAIAVTGNTVVDALLQTVARLEADAGLKAQLAASFPMLAPELPLVLMTSHRRESHGRGIERICRAVRDVADRRAVQFVCPVHPNPGVHGDISRLLGGHRRIHLVEPLDYLGFVYLLTRSAFVLTDSGGIQEEAPSLGKPVLVMRETTERPEGIAAGVARLVGTTTAGIVAATEQLLDDHGQYRRMAAGTNPYGDGRAAARVVSFISEWWERADRTAGEAPAAV